MSDRDRREELRGLNHPDTEELLDRLLAENERLRELLAEHVDNLDPVLTCEQYPKSLPCRTFQALGVVARDRRSEGEGREDG